MSSIKNALQYHDVSPPLLREGTAYTSYVSMAFCSKIRSMFTFDAYDIYHKPAITITAKAITLITLAGTDPRIDDFDFIHIPF